MAVYSQQKTDRAAVVSDEGSATPFDLGWIGRSTGRAERRQVVVLAIGFHPIADADPEDLAELHARQRVFVARIVARYGGKLGRVDPDQQLAAWGWPVACEADTRLAVAAALDIAADADMLARCGVDAGIAITPDVDDPVMGLGFVGEMIGTAVERQSAARPGEVAVSDTVHRLVGRAFEAERHVRGDQRLVLRRRAAHAHDLGPARPVVLVGRDVEQSELMERWHAAASGRSGLVLVEGEAGVGKSALVGEFVRKILESGGRVIEVRCVPETQHVALEPIRLLLYRLERLASHSRTLDVDANGSAVACRTLLEQPEPPVHELAAAIGVLLARKCATQAVAVVIEDLHWADAATLDFLRRIAAWQRISMRALMVGTARGPTEAAAARTIRDGWQSLVIQRLTSAQIAHVISNGEHGAGLCAKTRQLICDHADGIPLYAGELAKLCAQTPDSNAHHRLLARPNRLNAGLTQRLDSLAGLKPLAQAASVLGRLFDSRVLAAALDMDVRALDERLDMLVNMEVLARRRRHEACHYRFQHALLWSQAYGSVLKTRRRTLHLKIAGLLSGELGRRIEIAPEQVAHHWTKGGDPGQSFTWWCQAALAAAEQGAAASAVAYINHALSAKQQAPGSGPPHDEAVLMSVLGAQLRTLRGSASLETVAAYQRALELVSMSASNSDLDLDIAWGLAAIHIVRGEIHDAAETSSRLVSDASERGRGDIAMIALRIHGTARLLAGYVQEAIDIFRDAASRYNPRTHGELHRRYTSDPGAVALAHLAQAQALAADSVASRQSRRKALAVAGDLAHPHTTANVLGVLALSAVHLGEPGVAAALSRASLRIAAQHGHTYWEVRAKLILAWKQGLREPERGLATIAEELERYRNTGAGRAVAIHHCLAAELAMRAGLPRRALEFLAPVLSRGQQHGEWLYFPEILRLQALAEVAIDPSAASRAMLAINEAEALANDHGSTVFVARAVKARAVIEAVAVCVLKPAR